MKEILHQQKAASNEKNTAKTVQIAVVGTGYAGLASRMKELSSALDVIVPLLKGDLIYLDYPVHSNVGDLLIWHGAKVFFKKHKKDFIGQYSIDNVGKRAERQIEMSSTICLHGGGNFGDLWARHQKFRERIIQKYLNKRIIILPQSVHFSDVRELDKACEIIKKHPDIHVFLRDKNSFGLLEERGVPNIALCPDMAHALWGTLSAGEPITSSPLYLLRRDKEESFLPPEVASLRSQSVDWYDIMTGRTLCALVFGMLVNRMDGWVNNILPAYTVWDNTSKILIDHANNILVPHETIITNRLHAMILAALFERKAVVYDNSYGKISSYADLWMKDVQGIEMHTRTSQLKEST